MKTIQPRLANEKWEVRRTVGLWLTMTEILLPQREMTLKRPLTETKWKHPRNQATSEMKLTKRKSMAEDLTARQLTIQLNLFHSFEKTMSGYWKYITGRRHHCSHQQDEAIWLQAICGFPLKLSEKTLKEACLSVCVRACVFVFACLLLELSAIWSLQRSGARNRKFCEITPPHTHTHTHTHGDMTSGGNVSMSPSVWSFPITLRW